MIDNRSKQQVGIRGQGRARLIAAVLDCFRERGSLTISGVCSKAGASIGTAYHHFPGGPKEMLSAVYLEVRIASDQEILETLVRHRSFNRGIKAAIKTHLDWMAGDLSRAFCLLHVSPHWLTIEDCKALVREVAHVERLVDAWYGTHAVNGEARPMPHLVYWPMLFGPASRYVKDLLAHNDWSGAPNAIRRAAPALAMGGLRAVAASAVTR